MTCIFVSWIAAAIINSLMKRLNGRDITAEELLIVRSLPCILIALVIVGYRVCLTPYVVRKAGFVIAVSSIAFYQAIELWGSVNPVISVIALMPAVNIYIAKRDGKHVPGTVYLSLVCLVAGIVLALKPWETPPNIPGLIACIICIVVAGIGFDMWGKAPSAVMVPEKVFWLSAWCVILAVIILSIRSIVGTNSFGLAKYHDPETFRTLVWFAIPATIYIFSTVIPFGRSGRMDTEKASVLLQGATPASMVGSYLLLGEELDLGQGVGVAVAFAGAGFIIRELFRANVSPTARPG